MGDGSPALRAILLRSRDAGFLGPGDVEDHVRHAEAFVAAAVEPARFLDLGSGGGVPGLVLALRWPSATGLLVDAQARRVRFLAGALDELEVASRVEAVQGRAEDLAWEPSLRGRFDVVTARSFGPPAVTAECGSGFLRAGGVLLVAEPPDAPDRWPHEGMASLGLADEGLQAAPTAGVRRLRSVAGPPGTVPRRSAAMRRNPAF